MNQFKPLENGMLIGPEPTADNLRQAKQNGIKTVIGVRMSRETPAHNSELVARSGLDYVNIPVNKVIFSVDQVDALQRVMRHMGWPFLTHCATGALAAMLRMLSQAKQNIWTAQRAFQEARAMGFGLENRAGVCELHQGDGCWLSPSKP